MRGIHGVRRKAGLKWLTVLAAAQLTALMLLGIAEAGWRGRITVVAEISIARWGIRMVEWKMVENPNNTGSYEAMVLNATTLKAWLINVTQAHPTWIAILVENNGTIPVETVNPWIEVQPANLSGNLTVETYLYGPYSHGGHAEVWSDVKVEDLPLNGNMVGSINLNPSQKAVIWVKIAFTGETAVEDVTVTIAIRHRVAA